MKKTEKTFKFPNLCITSKYISGIYPYIDYITVKYLLKDLPTPQVHISALEEVSDYKWGLISRLF